MSSLSSSYLPAEIIDLITFYVETGPPPRTSLARPFRITNRQTRKHLAGLRLVNKGFCHSASARLFRHMIALAGSSSHSKLPSVGRLANISNSSYAQYVRHVDIGYPSFPCSIDDVKLYSEDLTGLLSSCLCQFPNLKALEFHSSPSAFLPHDEMKASINAMIMALCYVPLPNLSELELHFPMTSDFDPLFAESISRLRIPIEETLSRLRHIGLHVYAQTNQQASATNLFMILELSTSLTSLSFSSTNYLSLDHLKLDSTVRLRCLSLHTVRMSSQTLVKIIEQCSQSLEYIELRDVKIESGTWREILSAMDGLVRPIHDGAVPLRTEKLPTTPTLFFTAEHVQCAENKYGEKWELPKL